MSTIKLPAASGGGSISLKGPSSAGSDTDFLDTSGNLTVTGTATVTGALTSSGSTTAANNTNTDANITAGTQVFLRQKGNHAGIGGDTYPSQLFSGTAGGDLELYTINSNCDVIIGTQAAERVRIQSGGGISFNGDTANANALSDYEEGDWTPASREGTITYSNAKYTKIGQLVWVNAVVTSFSERTTTTDIGVTGLPFQVAETCTGSCVFSRVAYTGDTQIASIASTTNRVQFLTSTQSSSGTWFYLDYEDLQASSSTIEFSIVYRTTA